MKKGISPIISVVLIIALTIVLFLIVSNWIQSSVLKPGMEETDERLTGQLDCLSTAIDISSVKVNSGGSEIKLNVDNTGDTDIYGLTIRVIGGDGSVGTASPMILSSVGPLGRIINTGTAVAVSPAVVSPNNVEVYPELAGDKICKDQFENTNNIGTY
ncbi:MAG: hypothetical protein KKG75_01110 [Nanoarchaeota archaeon]|nr:hypothetical protein [Nanoarchaeota archaeon]